MTDISGGNATVWISSCFLERCYSTLRLEEGQLDLLPLQEKVSFPNFNFYLKEKSKVAEQHLSSVANKKCILVCGGNQCECDQTILQKMLVGSM